MDLEDVACEGIVVIMTDANTLLDDLAARLLPPRIPDSIERYGTLWRGWGVCSRGRPERGPGARRRQRLVVFRLDFRLLVGSGLLVDASWNA